MSKSPRAIAALLIAAFTFTAAPNIGLAADAATIFKEKKCMNCHAWSEKGIEKIVRKAKSDDDDEDEDAKKAPDMSKPSEAFLKKDDKVAFLIAYLKKKEPLGKKKHKKPFNGTDEELKILAEEFAKRK